MAVRTSLNVSLTPELEQFVQERLASGRYQTASEVVREGLRLLELQERDRDAAYKALKAKLKRGAEQAERGEVVDGEEFLEQLIQRLESRSRESGAA
jgi:antitoxin ParD1/3/4